MTKITDIEFRASFYDQNGYCPCNDRLRLEDGSWDESRPDEWCDDIMRDHSTVADFLARA